jgi:protein O-GlcNAc transferase
VVTIRGRTAVARGGVSILNNLGHPEFIAEDLPQYVKIAVNLANDTNRRSDLRRTLRQEMEHSPLMNARQFARDIEAAYRRMWQTWCGQ